MNAVKGLFRLSAFCAAVIIAGYAVYAFSQTDNAQFLGDWWNRNVGDGAGLLILLGVSYFFPTIVAVYRNHNVISVFFVNLVFGWSIIGWVVAMVMAA